MAMTSTIKGYKTCIDCGQSFGYKSPKATRCPDCRLEYQRRAARKRYSPTGDKIGYNQKGPNNNNWVNGSGYFQQFRGDLCERCGSTKFLVVHHRDHNHYNNVPENFETLCKRCHQLEHRCWENLKKGIVRSSENKESEE